MSYFYTPYVNKATKQKNAAKETDKMRKNGIKVSPIVIEGRTIAKSVWGKAWCDALESHADYESRLARGRTYARNGSIVHLEATQNKVTAKVAGSSLYTVDIDFTELAHEKWKSVKERCKGQVSSLVDLLAGKVPATVMTVVSEKNQGLFPSPGQMKFGCSCPDWASMCKHVAAVLYGVGSRLDSEPELIFSLRGVNHLELLPEMKDVVGKSKKNALSEYEIGDVFGIDIAPSAKLNSKPLNKEGTSSSKKKTPIPKTSQMKPDAKKPSQSSKTKGSLVANLAKEKVKPKTPKKSITKKLTKPAKPTKKIVYSPKKKKL